jgi:hypothetical protein
MEQIGFILSKEIMGKLDSILALFVAVKLIARLMGSNLSKTVKIQLSDKAGKFGVFEVSRQDILQRIGKRKKW